MGQSTALTVVRWQKFGQDRLYVADDQGERFGWVDLADDVQHLERSDAEVEFDLAVAAYCAEKGIHLPDGRRRAHRATTAPTAVLRSPELTRADGVAAPGRGFFPAPASSPEARHRGVPPVAPADSARSALGVRLERQARPRPLALGRRPRCEVLHDVPLGERGAVIDHLVIGPAGVWSIIAANHPGADVWVGRMGLNVDGEPSQQLATARFQAERVADRLGEVTGYALAVVPIVVLTGDPAPRVTVEDEPEGVLVVDPAQLVKLARQAMRSDDRQLDGIEVELVFDQARLATTWRC